MRSDVTIFANHPNRRSFLALGLGTFAAVLLGGSNPTFASHPTPSVDVDKIGSDAAYKSAQAGEIILIDIRRPDEWLDTQVGVGAIGLDMRDENFVQVLVALRQANPDKPIALICRTGARSGYVTTTLTEQGFPGLVDVSDGMLGSADGPGWLKRGLPTYEGSISNVVARRNAVLP